METRKAEVRGQKSEVGNVVAKLALPLKVCGSGVRDARRKWREESG